MTSGWLVVGVYGVLTALWGTILALYLRHRRAAANDRLITMLLGVLALDALKSVIESAYFGLVWGANYGLLSGVFQVLGDPEALASVKFINLGVASVVLFRLVRLWVPEELARRSTQRDGEARLRKELEDQLRLARDAEERLALVITASSAYVWDSDLRSDTIWAAPEVAKWLGYELSEWPPKPWHVIVHPDDRARVLAAIKDVTNGGRKTYDLRHRVVGKTGVYSVQSVGAVVRDDQGRPVRFVGAVRDVTAEVAAEESRIQSQKLESLGLLAGGIAHDFNNLLTVVSASLELARRQEGKEDALALASRAVGRAAVLSRQLLSYAGRGTSAPKAIDLNQLVQSMGQLLEVSLPKGVRLVRSLGAGLPHVQADEAQLQQLVMNLITNAGEAIGERGGTVSLESEVVEVTTQPPGLNGTLAPGRYVRLTVRDDGAGIAPELQGRIFDPFFTTKGPGRGLGLAALAGILRAHKGGIALESVLGKGTTFCVYLPALSAVVIAEHPVAQASPTGRLELRVLFVDDDELVRRGTVRLLTALGCQVDQAATGLAAVEKVTAAPDAFDVVMMDLTMPEMGGEEAAGHLVELAPRLPIILSSGFTERPELPVGGLIFSLPKPYSAKELEAALRSAVNAARKGRVEVEPARPASVGA